MLMCSVLQAKYPWLYDEVFQMLKPNQLKTHGSMVNAISQSHVKNLNFNLSTMYIIHFI